MEKFTKTVYFTPAFDKRHKDPKKNYGIHNVEVKFLLKGGKGAVQFLLFTGWYLPETNKEYKSERNIILQENTPIAVDLGYHSLKPLFKGQSQATDKCPYLDNKPCYYDGSALNSEPILDLLIRKGDEAVWKELEKYYKELFEDVEKR